MGQNINQHELQQADVVVQPELGTMKGNDFNGRNLAILAGEKATLALMAEIKQKLKARREPALQAVQSMPAPASPAAAAPPDLNGF